MDCNVAGLVDPYLWSNLQEYEDNPDPEAWEDGPIAAKLAEAGLAENAEVVCAW